MVHEDKTRMTRDPELLELNPYYGGNDNETNEMRWRSQWEVQEWAYEQAYENANVGPLWKYLPMEVMAELGQEYLAEGPECAKEWVNEEIQQTIDVITNEQLENWVDGQFRLFAGYDVAQNGDTLEEGDYGTWVKLITCWELGIEDKLRGNNKYDSLPEGTL